MADGRIASNNLARTACSVGWRVGSSSTPWNALKFNHLERPFDRRRHSGRICHLPGALMKSCVKSLVMETYSSGRPSCAPHRLGTGVGYRMLYGRLNGSIRGETLGS